MAVLKLKGIDIDIGKFIITLYFKEKDIKILENTLLLKFDTPSRRFLCSLIAFIVIKMKIKKNLKFVSIRNFSKELEFIDRKISGRYTSNNPIDMYDKIRKNWHYNLPDLKRGYCFELINRNRIALHDLKIKEYDCSEYEIDTWSSLFSYNENNKWQYNFAVGIGGLTLDNIKITFDKDFDINAWEKFIKYLNKKNEKNDKIKRIEKGDYKPSQKPNVNKIELPDTKLDSGTKEDNRHFSEFILDSQFYQSIGMAQIPWKPCVVNINGFEVDDIQVITAKELVPIPRDIMDIRQNIRDNWKKLKEKNEEHPWPGFSYGLFSFTEDRSVLSERQTLSLSLHQTDYFKFLAVQEVLKKHNKISQKYDSLTRNDDSHFIFDELIPVPWLSQSISPTIVFIARDNKKEVAIFTKRSSRVGTGNNLIALPIDESPRRQPTPEELAEFDLDEDPSASYDNLDGLFYNALIRGAKEELGIVLQKENIKILAFGLETNRYMYSLLGIARTDFTLNYLRNSIIKAKDYRLEYKYPYCVPFTPESVYRFFANQKRDMLCPTTQFAAYYALCHCFEENRVAELFENYPKPI